MAVNGEAGLRFQRTFEMDNEYSSETMSKIRSVSVSYRLKSLLAIPKLRDGEAMRREGIKV